MRVRKMSGFTLVELMIVVVILGLLAAVAIPAFTRYVKRSRTSEAMTNLTRIYSAEFTYNQESHERGLSLDFGRVRRASRPDPFPTWTASTPEFILSFCRLEDALRPLSAIGPPFPHRGRRTGLGVS